MLNKRGKSPDRLGRTRQQGGNPAFAVVKSVHLRQTPAHIRRAPRTRRLRGSGPWIRSSRIIPRGSLQDPHDEPDSSSIDFQNIAAEVCPSPENPSSPSYAGFKFEENRGQINGFRENLAASTRGFRPPATNPFAINKIRVFFAIF